MKHITLINSKNFQENIESQGCCECRQSCQSAGKTEVSILSQECVNPRKVQNT